MQEKQNRQSNYDLLRIFATIAVIIIHANFHFFVDRFETPDLSPEFITAQVNELILIAAATISTLILSLIPAAAADHIWRRQTKLKDKWYGAKFWKAI